MTIEYLTLGLYFVFLIGIGLLFAKLNTNISDFIRGGAQATWWLAGSSMLMAGVSAFTFTGNASAAYDGGATVLIIYAANCLGFLLSALFLGAWFRQLRAITVMDIVRERFGPAAEQVSAYIAATANPVFAAVQLWALAVFASSVLGLPLGGTIVVIGLIVVFYSTTGGRWAVMATDFVQSLILFAITVVVAFLSLQKIGGFGPFFDYFTDPRFAEDFRFIKEPGQFDGDRFTLKWIIVIFCMQLFTQTNLNNAQRFLTLKDGREAKKAALFAFVLMAVGSIIWFIPPMAARFLFESEITALGVPNPAEASYAYMAMELLPAGLMGIMIAAMFSATMSSMDSGINFQVGIVVKNIVPGLRRLFGRPEGDPKRDLGLCKALTLVVGGVIINVSLFFAAQDSVELFDMFFVILSVIGLPMAFPLLTALILRGMPRCSFFVVFAACLVPSVYSFIDGKLFDNPWTVQDRTLWVFVFGFAASFLSLLLRRFEGEPSREAKANFYRKMHTPVDYAKEIGASLDHRQFLILGRVASAIGGLLLLLVLVPNPPAGRLAALFVAGFVLAWGAFLLASARRIRRREAAADAAVT
mgnify:CR=1 FL=1